MADNKKSILIYCDLIHTIKKVIDKDRLNGTNNTGELFYHILQYTNDLEPEPVNDTVDILFEPIKHQLKRDLKKWLDKSERNSEIAKAAWGKRKDANALHNDANAYERKQTKPDEADTDNDTVKDNDTVTVIVEEGVSATPPPNFGNDFSLTTQELNEKLYSDEIWIEATAMNLKIEKEDVKNSIPEYITNIIATGTTKKTLKDAKSHFQNWYRKRSNAPKPQAQPSVKKYRTV